MRACAPRTEIARIYQDRYGGNYSGGAWVAVDMARKEMEISEIETGILGGDTQAIQFWLAVADADWIAVGRTPDIALAALEAKQSAPPDRHSASFGVVKISKSK